MKQVLLDGELATDAFSEPQHDAFMAHRHDQSILSILAKQHGVKTFPLPTAAHDVRDVWSWEAGYCNSSFEWPLPNFRPRISTKAYPRGVYITHYKEMGHQRDSMEDCVKRQGRKYARVPLPDYVQSAEVLSTMEGLQQLEMALNPSYQARQRRAEEQRKRRSARSDSRGHMRRAGGAVERRSGQFFPWAVASNISLSPQQIYTAERRPPVSLVSQEINARELKESMPTNCTLQTTFGSFFFEDRPYMWNLLGCRGVFECAGSALRCGIYVAHNRAIEIKLLQQGRRVLRVCSCDHTESLSAARHWRDGHDHLANAAIAINIEYSHTSGEA